MKNIADGVRQGWNRLNRVFLLLSVGVVVAAPIGILGQTADAAQITNRSVLISTAQAGASATYTFGFTTATAGAIQGLEFQACTTALGTCTAPTGLSFVGAAFSSQSGFSQAGNFAPDTTGANNCIATSNPNVLCAKRTQAVSEAAGAKTVAFSAITNQNSTNCSSAPNCTFFVRMTTYSLTTYTVPSILDTGTVAASTTQLLTVNAAIQEQLAFCIGNTTVDNATSIVPTCASITGTSLSLGTLSSSNVSVSPVSVPNNGDAENGLAELSTNAVNGSTVTYDAIQQSGTNHLGTLRVAGAACNAGVVNTDQCINAIGTTAAHIVSGTENFGMTIAGVNCSNVGSTYSCVYASGTNNLKQSAAYTGGANATTYDTDANLVSGTSVGFYAWDKTGTTQTIASSSTIVGNEALILKFAATPNLVTPTGSYTAKADFVATPTY